VKCWSKNVYRSCGLFVAMLNSIKAFSFNADNMKKVPVLPLGAVDRCAGTGNATCGPAVTTTAGRLTRCTLDSIDELEIL